jgi:hypothetical protein
MPFPGPPDPFFTDHAVGKRPADVHANAVSVHLLFFFFFLPDVAHARGVDEIFRADDVQGGNVKVFRSAHGGVANDDRIKVSR